MKSKLALLASALGLFAVAPVWAGTIGFDFSSCATVTSVSSGCPGDIGATQATFEDSTDTYTVTAYGIDYAFQPVYDLFVKDDGASENGLGLGGTPDNEINYSSEEGEAIVLDMTDLIDNGMDAGTVTLGSLQSGESGTVCGLTFSGNSNFLLSHCQQVFESGDTAVGSTSVTWGAGDPYLLFFEPPQGSGNFLVDSLSAVRTNSVPEPGSALLFAFGLAGLALAVVRRKRAFQR